MIPIERLLYKLDLRLNKKSSTEHQSIPLEDKILSLNEAQLILIKQKLNSNNKYNSGFDSFKKRYADLQDLVVQFEKLNVTKTNEIFDSYSGDLDTLTKPYMLPLEIVASCDKNNCKNRQLYVFDIVKHGDLQTMMANNNYKPSFEYQETLAVISGSNIYIYTDSTFKVNFINISYLRYPQKMDYEGYEDFNGTPSTTINCELSEILEDELLDITTLLIAKDTENIPQVQLRNNTND